MKSKKQELIKLRMETVIVGLCFLVGGLSLAGCSEGGQMKLARQAEMAESQLLQVRELFEDGEYEQARERILPMLECPHVGAQANWLMHRLPSEWVAEQPVRITIVGLDFQSKVTNEEGPFTVPANRKWYVSPDRDTSWEDFVAEVKRAGYPGVHGGFRNIEAGLSLLAKECPHLSELVFAVREPFPNLAETLNAFPNLVSLSMGDMLRNAEDAAEYHFLKEMTGLRQLHLSLSAEEKKVAFMSIVPHLTHLTDLAISLPETLSDLEGLRALKDLQTAHLYAGIGGSETRDLSPVAAWTRLKQLSLPGSVDRSFLRELRELRTLEICFSHTLQSLDELSSLSKLQYLSIEDAYALETLSGIERLTSLQTLHFGFRHRTFHRQPDIVSLKHHPSLKEIHNFELLLGQKGTKEDVNAILATLQPGAVIHFNAEYYGQSQNRSGEVSFKKEEYEAAYRWYQLAVKNDNIPAHVNLGVMYQNGFGVTQNDVKAVTWFRTAAEQGHAEAQAFLGFMYGNGRGVARNDTEAVKWFRLAAEQGLGDAQYALGVFYQEGRGVVRNDGEAVKWYRMAAEQGHATAQTNLGFAYQEGRGVARDDAEAVEWFRLAAEQGHARAQNILGLMYWNGRGVASNGGEAAKWFSKAAKQGCVDSQLVLGMMLLQGEHIPANHSEAAKWCLMAAEQGHVAAQSNLGFMYYQGSGVVQSYSEAIKWYRLAAEQGHADSQTLLGIMYYNGEGTTRDLAEAATWYRRAAEQGHVNAQSRLGFLHHKGRGVVQSYTEAIKWYRRAAEQGHRDSQAVLGKLHFEGEGVPQNHREAAHWYSRAANQGCAHSQAYLGFMYYTGKGVEENIDTATKWLRMAADQGHGEAKSALDFMSLMEVLEELGELEKR